MAAAPSRVGDDDLNLLRERSLLILRQRKLDLLDLRCSPAVMPTLRSLDANASEALQTELRLTVLMGLRSAPSRCIG